jgi:opacity protein-like surface antigen
MQGAQMSVRSALNGAVLVSVFLGGLATGDPTTVHAQSADGRLPRSAFFVGAGAGAAFSNFGNQFVYNKGLSVVSVGGVPVASGQADGPPVQTYLGGQTTFSPTVQLGYMQRFGDSDWLWGAKFSYAYIGSTSYVTNLVIPQAGSSSNLGVSSFSGFSVTDRYEITLRHQTAFMPFVGRAFDSGFFYFGAGPSLSQVESKLLGVVGYATINGVLTDISGAPQSVTDNSWRFGTAATAGVTYFLTPRWFIDLSYVFSMPNSRTNYVASPFNNPRTAGPSFMGTLLGSYTADVSSHAVLATINLAF